MTATQIIDEIENFEARIRQAPEYADLYQDKIDQLNDALCVLEDSGQQADY